MKILYVIPFVPSFNASGPSGPKNFSSVLLRLVCQKMSVSLVIIGDPQDRIYAEAFVENLIGLDDFYWFDIDVGWERWLNRFKCMLSIFPLATGKYKSKKLA